MVTAPSLKDLEDALTSIDAQMEISPYELRNTLVLMLREAIAARHDRENEGDFRERD